VKRLPPEKRRQLAALLKAAYDAVLAEDHSSFDALVRGLK
jgi:hypothetical protein